MGCSVGSQFLIEYPGGIPARIASSSVALGGGFDVVDGFGFGGVRVDVDWRRARDRLGESMSS